MLCVHFFGTFYKAVTTETLTDYDGRAFLRAPRVFTFQTAKNGATLLAKFTELSVII